MGSGQLSIHTYIHTTCQIYSRDIEDITCPHVDMNFTFECSTRYLTSERSEQVRYRVEYEKIKFISTSRHVIFCLLYKHGNSDAFGDSPKISNHFPEIPKIFQNCSEGLTNLSVHFPNTFRSLLKISEEGPMMFRSYNNISEYFLKDYVAINSNGNLVISCVKISCLHTKAHLVFHWCLYNK